MIIDHDTLLERGCAAVEQIRPDLDPRSCILLAAALRTILGQGRIRVGACQPVDKVLALGGFFSPRDGTFAPSPYQEVGDDGSFNGHTWLEVGGRIVDVAHHYDGPGGDGITTPAYCRLRKLERRVFDYWRPTMRLVQDCAVKSL